MVPQHIDRLHRRKMKLQVCLAECSLLGRLARVGRSVFLLLLHLGDHAIEQVGDSTLGGFVVMRITPAVLRLGPHVQVSFDTSVAGVAGASRYGCPLTVAEVRLIEEGVDENVKFGPVESGDISLQRKKRR